MRQLRERERPEGERESFEWAERESWERAEKELRC